MEKYISGQDIRDIRKEAKKTTVRMAEFAGVKTRKTYENWEKDIGTPSINQFISMLIGCGKDPVKYIKAASNSQ
tara:strand:- start:3311 stop:3532 length:222 start_codon:yes stop_codon:yes gene_type:complete